jgi:integrase
MPRRAPGEGYPFKRERALSNGTVRVDYGVRLSLGYDGNGRRARKVVYGATMREAREKAEVLKVNAARGIAPSTKSVTVAKLVAQWLRHGVEVTDWTPATRHGYEGIARKYLIPQLGRHKVERLSPRHVQGMLDDAHAQGKAPGTVKNIKAALSSALDLAVRWDVIDRNVASRAVVPRMARKPVAPLTPDEAMRFLDAMRGHRLGALYTVTTALGLRQSEALGLLWSDIALEAGTLDVRQRTYWIDGEYHTGRPKSAHSQRTIPLPSAIVEALREHRDAQRFEARRAGEAWEDEDRVFPNTTGGPLHGPFVTRTMQALMKDAELTPRTFHGLRHTAATLLLTMGVRLEVIQETLGHASFRTTRDLHTHARPEIQSDAADKMDAFLRKQA